MQNVRVYVSGENLLTITKFKGIDPEMMSGAVSYTHLDVYKRQSLSGVGKRINENQELVYQRSFDIPSAWKGKQVLLHFGAVDWKTDV